MDPWRKQTNKQIIEIEILCIYCQVDGPLEDTNKENKQILVIQILCIYNWIYGSLEETNKQILEFEFSVSTMYCQRPLEEASKHIFNICLLR